MSAIVGCVCVLKGWLETRYDLAALRLDCKDERRKEKCARNYSNINQNKTHHIKLHIAACSNNQLLLQTTTTNYFII